MDEETIKDRLKTLNPEFREILYYRCPSTLKTIPDIAEIVHLSVPSINNRIRTLKDLFGVEDFGGEICRILIQEYGSPPYREEPDRTPDPIIDPIEEFFTQTRPEGSEPPRVPPPQPTSEEPQSNRGRNIAIAIFFGLAALIAIVIVCFVAYALLQIIDPSPTREPTSIALATDEPGSAPTSDIQATQSQIETAVVETITAEAPLPTFTLTEWDPPAQTPSPPSILHPANTPRPVDTPTPPNTPRPTATPIPVLALPFLDDFNDGLDPAWMVVGGNPIIVNGQISSPYIEKASIRLAEALPDSYAIDFDYDFDGSSHIELIFSDRNRFRAYYTGAWWYVRDGGSWDEILFTNDIRFGTDPGHARIVVDGNRYTIYLRGVQAYEFIQGESSQNSFTLVLEDELLVDNFMISPN